MRMLSKLFVGQTEYTPKRTQPFTPFGSTSMGTSSFLRHPITSFLLSPISDRRRSPNLWCGRASPEWPEFSPPCFLPAPRRRFLFTGDPSSNVLHFITLSLPLPLLIAESRHFFKLEEIRDWLLTKLYNGFMKAGEVPPLGRLFSVPRREALRVLGEKHPYIKYLLLIIFWSSLLIIIIDTSHASRSASQWEYPYPYLLLNSLHLTSHVLSNQLSGSSPAPPKMTKSHSGMRFFSKERSDRESDFEETPTIESRGNTPRTQNPLKSGDDVWIEVFSSNDNLLEYNSMS